MLSGHALPNRYLCGAKKRTVMQRDSIDLGTVKVSVLFRKFFIPTLLGMVSMSIVTVTDGIFVGHGVGSDGIAAINICLPMFMVFMGLGLMFGMGTSVVASIHISRSNLRAARINITQTLVFVTLLTALLSVLIIVFSQQAAVLLGSSQNLLPMVVDYIVWFVPSLVFNMWIAVGLFVIRLDGTPRYAMWCSVVSAAVNVLLDYVFIFPLGWGVRGAALASSLSIVAGGAMVAGYMLLGARTLKLLPLKLSRKSIRLWMRNIGYQCRIGASAMLGELTVGMLMLVGNHTFMHFMGDDGVGAFGIACYYSPFIFMVGNAIAQSAQPIISYNYGAGLFGRVSAALRVSLLTAFACGVVVMAVFILFPQAMVGLFIDSSSAAYGIAVRGLPYFATGFVCFILNLTVVGYYQSLERALPATVYSLLRGFVFLILSFIFVPRALGFAGIWLAMPVSETLTFAVIVAVWIAGGIKTLRKR